MSNALLIHNAKIITPQRAIERGWLFALDGKIRLTGSGEAPQSLDCETIDGRGLALLPGFVDVHVHGGVGYEVMDATPDALACTARFYAEHGVTAYLPTTWTDSHDRIDAALKMIAAHMGAQPDGATILGAHVEGPYLNPERSGAQSDKHIRRAGRDEALPWLDLGIIRLMALAPEYEENHWLIEECVKRGITVSAAHTAATYAQVRHAVKLGLTLSTHTFNAQTGLHHRDPGTVGAMLTSPEINCELIADTIHVHPAVMDILYRCKGADQTLLITDAIRGAGMPDGEYPIDERVVTIKDGVVRLPNGSLAGSTLTMDRALRNLMQVTGEPLEVLWKTSSLNAARAIHVDDRKGSLEAGKDADLVLVDDAINVHLTAAEGRIVYRKGV